MKDDELPPLPPPLPPTHSRSFSSSSSSSAGSPQPPTVEWSRRVATETTRSASPRGESSLENGRTNGGGTVITRATRASRSEATESPSRAGDYINLGRSTASPQPPTIPSLNPASSTTPTIEPPSNNSTQRTRASAFLSKVSPSLSSHSRYSSSPSNIANIGLRGSPEPLGLGIGVGNLTRHLGGLPSPPPTNSDGGSLEGGSRYGTVRSNGTDSSARSGSGNESGGGNVSPLKPDRPPKSERRASNITPTKESSVPSIGRISPTIAGSSTNSPSRSSSVNERFRRSDSAASFRRSGSPSPVSSLTPSASLRSLDRYTSDGSGSEAMEELRDSLVGVEPRRRLRARTGSEGAQETLDTDGAERRRDTQSRKANELKEKNQKILDSINSQLLPLVSPPSSQRGVSPAPSQRSSAPRQVIQRSSTSSTIRSLAGGEDDLIRDSQPNFGNSTDEDDLPRPHLDRTLRSASSTDLGEFGVPQAEAIRRSATLGDVSDHLNNFDRDRNARTAGYRSKPRTSLPQQFDDTLPNRSATSMSNYPSTAERIRARRSDLVGSERTRAASSFGDTRQQDSDFSEGMRRLASRELLRTPRDRSKSHPDSLDSPSPSSAVNNVSPPSLRNRPALPTEFRQTPSTSSSTYTRTPRRSLETSTSRLTPSSSSSRDLDRFSRPRSTNPSLVSPISSSSSSVSPQDTRRQARSEVSFDDGYSGDDQNGGEERERTPKSARKAAFDRVGSVGRARTSLGSIDRRTNSVSESMDRPYSRLSRDERRSGRRSPGASSRGTATPPPPPSSARSEDRYSTGADLSARKERLRKSEVGSPEWMAELDNLRTRGTRSRASGISGDGRSDAGDRPPRSPSVLERDRTVKAINALLAGQGIVASAVDPSSPTGSSPTKRTSTGAYERHRRISFANGTHTDSPSAPGSNTMSRSNSNTSRAGSESVLQGLINHSSSGDHHKLLLSAFDQFDRHFSQDQAETPESAELVKRMVALISSTTKLNNGLRALTEAIKEEHVQAQLDEGQRNPTVSITHFEKSINALLRSSDDQVRNLSEDLIAFTRVERERDRIRKDQETLSRPVSRAGDNLHKPLPLSFPSKRPATASSVEGATVSQSSSRSPVVSREILRNPLDDPNDSLPPRRSTLHFGGRSPFATTDSPSPASRRDLASQRSPLASETNFETPSRRQSISTSSTLSSGTGSSSGRPGNRRAKYSDPARSSSQSGAVPFPTATHSSPPIPQVDATPAITGQSPTRVAASFPKRPVEGPPRTYSGASADAIAFEALEMAANVDEARSREERAAALDRLEQSRAYSPTSTRSIISTPPSEPKRPRTRSSMGALGSVLKNALRSTSRS